ncbi:MAG: hypothetical protein ABSF44_01365 [Candidatus Bathyarchaeia archaeon]|jgi:hypothetical protein
MHCNDARTFFSQIAEKSISIQIQQTDMDYLRNGGYLSVMQKEDYDRASAEVSNLTQMNIDLVNAENADRSAKATLQEEDKKTHSIKFYFEGKETKEAEREKEESEKSVVSKMDADIAERDTKINELIQKKSIIDRMVPYGGQYLSLTGLGVITLNDLNVRNYRVADSEFSDFVEETRATYSELRSIADRGSFHVSNLRIKFPEMDLSQLWSVSIGLAKLQGDPNQIGQRFLFALDLIKHFDSTLQNKMMAAEIMASSRADPAQSPNNSDLQNLSELLVKLDRQLRHDAHVPKPLSVGVAATVLFGRRFDGTFSTDRFVEFSKMTSSFESAAILSITNEPSDQLAGKFQSFRSLFNSWGFQVSEDTELASAYLSISDLAPDEVKLKMSIIENGLRNYLEYPLVASAVLASIPTLEANETLDLMEKAYSLLGSYAADLERSEMISLAVRMIHGIKNELVKQLDPTATIVKTPVQFTYVPTNIFFLYYAPLIIAHSSYYSTFSGIGGFHPAHVHGVGGFMG